MPKRAFRLFLPLLFPVAACQPPGEPAEIRFDVYWRDTTVRCAGNPEPAALTDLRLSVHDVEFETDGGRRVPFRLSSVEGWQTAEVALIDLEDGDLEDGGGRCLNGTPGRDLVVLDLARLFDGANLGDGTVASCQVGPDEDACGPILESLGLEFATGESTHPAAAFRSVRAP